MGENQVFGEEILLKEHPRSLFSARCVQDSCLYVVNRYQALNFMNNN